ncbi:MAG TPA: hypothetical protein VGP53_01160 [Acidimicrobiales bacterium]|nr:hypothetical protein [Acidimicrobiales bacterium]
MTASRGPGGHGLDLQAQGGGQPRLDRGHVLLLQAFGRHHGRRPAQHAHGLGGPARPEEAHGLALEHLGSGVDVLIQVLERGLKVSGGEVTGRCLGPRAQGDACGLVVADLDRRLADQAAGLDRGPEVA